MAEEDLAYHSDDSEIFYPMLMEGDVDNEAGIFRFQFHNPADSFVDDSSSDENEERAEPKDTDALLSYFIAARETEKEPPRASDESNTIMLPDDIVSVITKNLPTYLSARLSLCSKSFFINVPRHIVSMDARKPYWTSAFPSLKKLRLFDAGHLDSWHDHFLSMQKLTHLELTDNRQIRVFNLPELEAFPCLQVLDLRVHRLADAPNFAQQIGAAANLRELYISARSRVQILLEALLRQDDYLPELTVFGCDASALSDQLDVVTQLSRKRPHLRITCSNGDSIWSAPLAGWLRTFLNHFAGLPSEIQRFSTFDIELPGHRSGKTALCHILLTDENPSMRLVLYEKYVHLEHRSKVEPKDIPELANFFLHPERPMSPFLITCSTRHQLAQKMIWKSLRASLQKQPETNIREWIDSEPIHPLLPICRFSSDKMFKHFLSQDWDFFGLLDTHVRDAEVSMQRHFVGSLPLIVACLIVSSEACFDELLARMLTVPANRDRFVSLLRTPPILHAFASELEKKQMQKILAVEGVDVHVKDASGLVPAMYYLNQRQAKDTAGRSLLLAEFDVQPQEFLYAFYSKDSRIVMHPAYAARVLLLNKTTEESRRFLVAVQRFILDREGPSALFSLVTNCADTISSSSLQLLSVSNDQESRLLFSGDQLSALLDKIIRSSSSNQIYDVLPTFWKLKAPCTSSIDLIDYVWNCTPSRVAAAVFEQAGIVQFPSFYITLDRLLECLSFHVKADYVPAAILHWIDMNDPPGDQLFLYSGQFSQFCKATFFVFPQRLEVALKGTQPWTEHRRTKWPALWERLAHLAPSVMSQYLDYGICCGAEISAIQKVIGDSTRLGDILYRHLVTVPDVLSEEYAENLFKLLQKCMEFDLNKIRHWQTRPRFLRMLLKQCDTLFARDCIEILLKTKWELGTSTPDDPYRLLWKDLLAIQQSTGVYLFRSSGALADLVTELVTTKWDDFSFGPVTLILTLIHFRIFSSFEISEKLIETLTTKPINEDVYSLLCSDPTLSTALSPYKQPREMPFKISEACFPCTYMSVEEILHMNSS